MYFPKIMSKTVTIHGAGYIEADLSICHLKYLQKVVLIHLAKIGFHVICEGSDCKSGNWSIWMS